LPTLGLEAKTERQQAMHVAPNLPTTTLPPHSYVIRTFSLCKVLGKAFGALAGNPLSLLLLGVLLYSPFIIFSLIVLSGHFHAHTVALWFVFSGRSCRAQ